VRVAVGLVDAEADDPFRADANDGVIRAPGSSTASDGVDLEGAIGLDGGQSSHELALQVVDLDVGKTSRLLSLRCGGDHRKAAALSVAHWRNERAGAPVTCSTVLVTRSGW
jgi:hypothetical protein